MEFFIDKGIVMIFIGCNHRVGFARYDNHHPIWTDSRCLPRFIRIWWNNLKDKKPIYQIIEQTIRYGSPYCERCMEKFIETGDTFVYFHGIKNPSKQDRIDICNRLRKRFQ